MLKKSLTIFVLILVSASLLLSRDIPTLKRQIADDAQTPTPVYLKTNPPRVLGETVITTNYDYFSNALIRDQITFDPVNKVPHLFTMIRPFNPAAPAVRHVVHSFRIGGDWINQSVSAPFGTGAGGWPSIDIGLTGTSLTGTVAMAFHTVNRLAVWDGSTGYNYTPFPGGDPLDPTIQIVGNTYFMASSGNRGIYRFFKSEDLGQTIVQFDSIQSWSPTPIFWKVNGGVEVGMSKSPNEQYLLIFGTNEGGAGAVQGHVFAGWPKDSADNAWIILSTNGGGSFTGKSIGWDGDPTLVVNYEPIQLLGLDSYAPLFENFGQVDAAVDNNGKVHYVANGYGLGLKVVDDTLRSLASLFPVLYWNSESNTWRALTYIDPNGVRIDTNQAVITYYPTNSIGQAYPSVSVSADGNVVFIMWTGPQLKADGTLDTAFNGSTSLPRTYYWRDLYYTYSVNGGNTFTPVQKFAECEMDKSEVFGHAVQHLEKVDAQTYRAHIVYLSDLTTGVQPFDGVSTANPIVYTTFDIISTSVDNKGNVISSYNLSQNYPNPFNPVTNIKFTVAERAQVVLKVFDVLGREVATLVNEVKDAGQYTVKFDAKDLPSGMYLYTLTAGNYSATKKMMLIK